MKLKKSLLLLSVRSAEEDEALSSVDDPLMILAHTAEKMLPPPNPQHNNLQNDEFGTQNDAFGTDSCEGRRKKRRKKMSVMELARLDPEIYPHQCKTCKRRFECFQALGGHRASCSAKAQPILYMQEEIYVSESSEVEEHSGVSAFKKKGVHQCPVCFKTFPSGQALGGHKRSHSIARSTPLVGHKRSDSVVVNTTEVAVSSPSSAVCEKSASSAQFLLPDLNLTPPTEDPWQQRCELEAESKAAATTDSVN